VTGQKAAELADLFGGFSVNATTKRLPREIWLGNPAMQLSCLVGLLDGDGCYLTGKKTFSYATASIQLCRDVMALAGLLGLRFRLRRRPPRKASESTMYEVVFAKSPWLFQAMERLSARHEVLSWSFTKGLVPLNNRFRDELIAVEAAVGTTMAWRTKVNLQGIPVNLGYWLQFQKATRVTAAMVLSTIGEGRLAAAVNSGLLVTKIESTNDELTLYDLTVPGNQTYLAGEESFVVAHNTGFSFSRIRPAGDPVMTTKGVASGPISFMRGFDMATDIIKQGGARRGANMGILRCDHPDIEAFITCKNDTKSFTNFNLSVGLTDAFMEAVKSGADFPLINPRTREEVKKVKSAALFDLIVQSAWATGEPGIIFLDAINRANTLPHLGEIESTNPCVTGDTLVATPNGYRQAKDFCCGDTLWTVLGTGTVSTIERHENYPVFRVEFSDGGTLRVTSAHQFHAQKQGTGRFATKKFDLYRLDQLEIGDWVRVAPACLPNNLLRQETYALDEREYGFLVGILLGDGCITESSMKRRQLKVASRQDDEAWNDILSSLLSRVGYTGVMDVSRTSLSLSHCINGVTEVYRLVENLGISAQASDKRIPAVLRDSNERVLAGLVDGLFSTDGNVNLASTHPTLRFASASRGLIADLRDVLLMFGIHGSMGVTENCRQHEYQGRIIKGQTKYEYIISGASLKSFYDRIGLTRPYKMEKLKQAVNHYALTGNTWKARVLRIEPDGFDTVYDLFEPISDTWITNGYVSRGCGEQPLLPYESCNLGSLNLAKVVKDGEVDYEMLGEMVHTAVHFLDNVIDANRFPLDLIREKTVANRKIGLGVMGFADLLLKLGIPYNSEEAVAVAEEVMNFINEQSKLASTELAGKRGNFPNFPGSSYENNGLSRMRNATTTTIAPTGTISIIAGCSSGIEPLFAVSFKRRVLEGEELVEVHPYFEEIAKSRGFYSPELIKQIAETGSIRDFQEIPRDVRRLFVTAHEVSPHWHLKIQAAFQKHTDNAVSKTVNFPRQATAEDVREVYLQAYELGLKGVTIYRDGSRDQQVLSFGADKPQPQYITPRPRPQRTIGVTEYIKTGCGKLYVTVNQDELGFCEVFAQMGKTGGCASSQIESAGRLISLALRSGVKIEAIIKQISGLRCPSPCWNGNGKQVLSCPDAIAKVLARVAEVEPPAPVHSTMGACPDCGGALEQEGGCAVCRGCGFSKC
jgi:ribonucleoside-diphosphate reductase alpha chain